MLPKARVVYCSATGVSDVKNMVSTRIDYTIFNGGLMKFCQIITSFRNLPYCFE